MTPEDWAALKAAFAELVELAPEERTERLARMEARHAEVLGRLLHADADIDSALGALEPTPRPADADPLALCGSTVAQFRVLRVLGRGGMGIAYEAEDTRLGRIVALKFLLPHFSADPDARARFLNEARAASALDHPNVCTLLEIGDSPHGLFFAMPAYPGETLKDRLAREGSLGVADAVAIVRRVLHGLDAAHHAGIVHRDLKPANVMLTAGGDVRILDFGLARVGDPALSAPGSLQGTVAYMSPEQVAGEKVDRASDLWSTGILFYEMITGTRPFGGGHDLSTIYSILHQQPARPSSLRDDIPPAIDALILRLLSRDPTARFPTARDVLAALDDATTAGPPSLRRRVRTPAALAFATGALLLAAIPLTRGFGGRATPPASPAVAVLPFVDTSPDRSQEYLGEGIAEEILNVLTQLPELRVPARGSSFAFRGSTAPPEEIARRLGVDALLEGSVHRAGDSIRVSARLVDAHTRRYLWARTFERPFADMYQLQAEIAHTVARALEPDIAPPSTMVTTAANAAAIELHFRGLFHFNRRTVRDLRLAIQFFEQATLLDSTFARPWAGLAMAYVVLAVLDPSATSLLHLVDDAAARAIALDPQLAEAHAARGYAQHWLWRWNDAEHELRLAITLNPRLAIAHQWLGEHLAKMGRFTEGETLMRRAIALDPLSLVARNDLGIVMLLARRYPEAVAQFDDVLRADPAFPLPNLLLHRVHMLAGDPAAAARAGRRWAELTNLLDPDQLETLARATRDSLLRHDARTILHQWEQAPLPRWFDIAMYYALFGDHEAAIRALEHALAVRAPMMAGLKVVAWVDPLRPDPRVQAILRQLAFPLP